MIVKNEAHVIRRCLDSIKSIIDYWVIVDTGSTDGTQDIIKMHLKDIPGTLYEKPWINSAHNRTEALQLSKDHGDYSLLLDADDTYVMPSDFKFPILDKDAYMIESINVNITYQCTQLVSNKLNWKYEGVIHEFISCDTAYTSELLSNIKLQRGNDGARSKDPFTYRKDAEILEEELKKEISDFLRTRYIFYLAQSYKDCGNKEKALENYNKRTTLGYWDQEIYISYYNIAQLQESLNYQIDDILKSYLSAIKICPERAEAYHGASKLLRENNRFKEGYNIAKQGLNLLPPKDGLFISHWIYIYGLLDEYSVNAYWAGYYKESLNACEQILKLSDITINDRLRIQNNAKFAKDKNQELNINKKYSVSSWEPEIGRGGTCLMKEGLLTRLSNKLECINLQINLFTMNDLNKKPLILWMHHDSNQASVQWCKDISLVNLVNTFIFVSYWQMNQYIRDFNLPFEKCIVLKNTTANNQPLRTWKNNNVKKVAYTITPFRGLDILLDSWELLNPNSAELHIWSSLKLYGKTYPFNNGQYDHLFTRANNIPNVYYRGIVPNDELKKELTNIDFLAYPSTFAETSCISVIDAMSVGCRVICSSLGALPETTAGFAKIYPYQSNKENHIKIFADVLKQELNNPWDNRTHLSWEQQIYCQIFYDWDNRSNEWKMFLSQFN